MHRSYTNSGALGYCFCGGRWYPTPHAPLPAWRWGETDAMHSQFIQRADTLIGCTAGSADQDELEAIEAYESVRYPDGSVDARKG